MLVLLVLFDELAPPPPFFFFLLFDVAGGGAGLVFRPGFRFQFSIPLQTSFTWYCNYWWRDDKGINLEVGDVWHVRRPVRSGAVTAMQPRDETAVAGLE